MVARSDQVHATRIMPGETIESERRLPVRAEVGVVVCGGGPAGVREPQKGRLHELVGLRRSR